MSQNVTCAACKTVLRVPGGCTDRWLTCPRCLGTVENTTARVASSPAVLPAAGSTDSGCPECGKALEPTWRFCPYCKADSTASRPQRQPTAQADADVRFDTGLLGIGLVVLGMLGAVAIFFGTFSYVQGPRTSRKVSEVSEVGMTGLVGEVILLLFVVLGIVLTSVSRNVGVKIGGAVAGGLTIAALIVVLFCSGFVLVFSTCLGR